MSTGGARRGRRDNGLEAAVYAAAGDVDPRVGEHLLDVLAAGGIAAYLQPSADQDPFLRATTYPARPTDRLYVDRTRLAVAREHLHRLTGGTDPVPADPPPAERPRPGGSQREVDAAWAAIVAGFHADVDPTAASWPAAENTGPGTAGPARPGDPAAPAAGTARRRAADAGTPQRRRTDPPPDEPSLLDALDAVDGTADDDEERYTPPPPPPLPRISKITVAGALGIFLGFVLFLFPDLVPIDRDVVTLAGFAAVVAGAVTLVWRLRSGDEDDDPDDGAVV